MGAVLRWTGGGWAIIGAANVVMMPWGEWTPALIILGLVFNMVLFVLPGLMVYGIGGVMAKKRGSRQTHGQ